MKNTFKELIIDFHAMEIPKPINRNVNIPKLPANIKKAITLIGMRRVGKTWTMYQMMQQLLITGISKSQILYINFEDDRLNNIKITDLQALLDAYYELYPQHADDKTLYFFIDEIQNVDCWEKFIRRLIDTENINIVLSGSSAKLLSLEIATSLRGRTINREIFPLSFAEYCDYKKVALQQNPSKKQQAIIQHHYNNYFIKGGFPEVLNIEGLLYKEIIQSYVLNVN